MSHATTSAHYAYAACRPVEFIPASRRLSYPWSNFSQSPARLLDFFCSTSGRSVHSVTCMCWRCDHGDRHLRRAGGDVLPGRAAARRRGTTSCSEAVLPDRTAGPVPAHGHHPAQLSASKTPMTAWWMPPIHLSMARAQTTVSVHPSAAKDKKCDRETCPWPPALRSASALRSSRTEPR